MQLLQIALALAVTMLIFSTLATMLVETVFKVFGFRAMGLKRQLGELFEAEVRPIADALAGPDAGGGKDAFVEAIRARSAGTWIPADEAVSTVEFARRLATTDLGRTLMARGADEVDTLVDDLCVKFEESGRQASQRFRRDARWWNLVVGVVLAFGLNVNVYNLIVAYREDAELTQRVALYAEQAGALHQAAAAADERAAPEDGTPSESVRKSVEEMRATLAATQELGIPFGWRRAQAETDPAAEVEGNVDFAASMRMHFGYWILTTFVSGLLIGLGGPFWFDVIRRLQPVARFVSAVLPARRTSAPTPDGEVEEDRADTQPPDPRSMFRRALEARAAVEGASPLAPPRAVRGFAFRL